MTQGNQCTNEKLKAARKELDLTQKEVAERIGAPEISTISDWEHGRNVPGPHYREKLRNLFDKSDEALGFSKPAKKARKSDDRGFVELAHSSSSKEQDHQNANTTRSDEKEEACIQLSQSMLVECTEDISSAENDFDATSNPTLHPEQSSNHQEDSPLGKQQKQLLQVTLSITWPVLLKVLCVLLLCAVVIFSALKILLPPPVPEDIHSQLCPAHPTDYVVVYTTKGTYCFSGTGIMAFHASVTRVDTGNYIASWRYTGNTGDSREPSNTDNKLHVCSHLTVSYSSPVQLYRIFTTSLSAKVKCTSKVSST